MNRFNNADAQLSLIPTPVGNLGDVTKRAAEVLSDADIIFCEDTRRARILLKSLGISKKLRSLHSYNEKRRTDEVIGLLNKGLRVAYISDSGTPGISDPGAALVRAAQQNRFPAAVLPGPTALAPAVVMSGLPCDSFLFMGFAPASATKRRRLLRKIAEMEFTLVFYESPHRISKMLDDCLTILGEQRCAIVREISKIHEEVLQGTLSELVEYFAENQPRGEMVLVVASCK